MHAEQIAETYPAVAIDSSALEAAQLLASHRLPGLIVVDKQGHPCSVLPASQVVRFLVPQYVQDDPSLAGVLDESMADRAADKLGDRTVRSLLPDPPPPVASVKIDDTIVEVAAVMARLRCPLAAVLNGREMVGVITASRLLEVALRPH